MKTKPSRDWPLRHLTDLLHTSNLGVPKEQVDEAINQSELRLLPFIYGSILLLFLAYALIQAAFLREPGLPLLLGVAAFSLIALAVVWWMLTQNRFAPRHVGRLGAFLAFVVLINIQLRFYLTHDPKQAANLALFVFAVSVLFLSLIHI